MLMGTLKISNKSEVIEKGAEQFNRPAPDLVAICQ